MFPAANGGLEIRRRSFRFRSCIDMENGILFPVPTSGSVSGTSENNNIEVVVSTMPLCNFLHSWRPLLYILKIFGFYPWEVGDHNVNRCCKRFHQCNFWYAVIVCLILLNLFFLYLNAVDTNSYWSDYGTLHYTTVTSIIVGLLPLQNAVNLFIFMIGQKVHRQLLQQLDFVHSQFQWKMDATLCVRSRVIGMALATGITLLVLFLIRIWHFLHLELPQGVPYFAVVPTFFIVPLLRVWQLLPLFYFEAINSAIRFWFKQLNKTLQKDKNLRKNPLNFYYKHFLQLTVVVYRLGKWLNPFIFFSIAFSLVNVCLAVYFVAETNDRWSDFFGADPEEECFEIADANGTNLTSECEDSLQPALARIHITYATVQVLISIVYLLVICITGRRTNEEARKILATILTINCTNEEDRFSVIRFVQKIHCQYYWGITVWRTFPIERGLLFTITSGVIAYATILRKMKKDDCIPTSTVTEILRNVSANFDQSMLK